MRARLALLFVVLAGPASAEDTIRCADARGEVHAEIDIAFADEERSTGAVSRVDVQFADFSMSTKPADPDQRPELLADQVSEVGRLEIYLSDPAGYLDRPRLRLFKDVYFERQFSEADVAKPEVSVVAGTLSAMGVGIWAVTCTGW